MLNIELKVMSDKFGDANFRTRSDKHIDYLLVRIIEKDGVKYHKIIERDKLQEERKKIEGRGGKLVIAVEGEESIRKKEREALYEFYEGLLANGCGSEVDEGLVLVEFVESVWNKKAKSMNEYLSRLYGICEANFKGVDVNLNFFLVAIQFMNVHHMGVEYLDTKDFLDSRGFRWDVIEHDICDSENSFYFEGSRDNWIFLLLLKYMVDERIIEMELRENLEL